MSNPITEWLNSQQENMVKLLADLVNIDSNSFDKQGVDKVAERLREFFDEHSVTHETMALKDQGDVLRVIVSGGDGNRPLLLCGHRDTVFPTGEVKKRPFEIKNGRAFGPGVADMKPGLVMNAFILAAPQTLRMQPK